MAITMKHRLLPGLIQLFHSQQIKSLYEQTQKHMITLSAAQAVQCLCLCTTALNINPVFCLQATSGEQGLLQEAGSLRHAQHHVQVLDGLPRCTLDQVVNHCAPLD